MNMEEKIKDKVREIQAKYCGEAVETKLYYAIEETIKQIKDEIKHINSFIIRRDEFGVKIPLWIISKNNRRLKELNKKLDSQSD